MQTLGQKLEEARTRKGISIREASESIKVRGDFLVQFENNDFTFSLPDIYKRGFLKNYARYLELDTDKVMDEFEKLYKPGKKAPKRDAREYLGKIELGEDLDEAPANKMHVDPKFAKKPVSPARSSVESSSAGLESRPRAQSARQQPQLGDTKDDNRDLYVKLSIYIGSGIVALIIIGLIISFFTKDTDETSYTTASTTQSTESISDQLLNGGNSGNQAILPQDEVIYAIAKDAVNVKIRQEYDKKILLNRTLRKGDRVRILKQGPIKIYCSEVSNFRIGKNGKEYKMGSSGPGIANFN